MTANASYLEPSRLVVSFPSQCNATFSGGFWIYLFQNILRNLQPLSKFNSSCGRARQGESFMSPLQAFMNADINMVAALSVILSRSSTAASSFDSNIFRGALSMISTRRLEWVSGISHSELDVVVSLPSWKIDKVWDKSSPVSLPTSLETVCRWRQVCLCSLFT